MKGLALYTRYALRSFLRGRTRSLFGVFCVAVGVASVVALGLTASNFRDSVTGDAHRLNRGDLSASPPGNSFTLKQYHALAALKSRGVIVNYTRRLQDDASLLGKDTSTVGTIVGVDPRVFPYYDTIRADQPKGVTIRELLRNPGSTVVSHDTLASLHLKVGDRITVNSRQGFDRTYTIAGVVPDSAIDPFFGAGFWNDFAMVNNISVASFFHSINVGATTVYAVTSSPEAAEQAKPVMAQALGPLTTVKTVKDVAADQENQAAGFDKFFKIMGLVAMVIGGIGIINSMLVAARRRTKEIAVLKSLGMKGRQVIVVFSLEALMLAVFGTVAGSFAGIGISVAVNGVTENLAGNPIPWSLHAEPLLAGGLVGIVATLLFAYLPIVQASRARPIATLRETASANRRGFWKTAFSKVAHPVTTVKSIPGGIVHLPKRQGVRTFLTTLFVATAIGTLAMVYSGLASGTDVFVKGAIAGIGTLIAAGLITQLFVGLVWLVSKFPAFGRLSARMAFRSMATQKRRLASTMLALCVGMLSVGSVAIVAQNIRSEASNAIGNQLGFNTVVQVPQSSSAFVGVAREVSRLKGVRSVHHGAVSTSASILTIDGKDPRTTLEHYVKSGKVSSSSATNVMWDLQGIEARDARDSSTRLTMTSGRYLNASDAGTNHIVIGGDLASIDAHVGSTVVFGDAGKHYSFTVVGISATSSMNLMASSYIDLGTATHLGLTSPSSTHHALYYLQVDSDQVQPALHTLRSSLPGALVLDLSNFTTMINKSIDKLQLFPEIIAALSLFAGVIIIANTVALAMLERRREIGVLKALGAKRATILRLLAIENAVAGLLGAGAGVGLAMIATALVDAQFLKISASFDWKTIGALLALGVLLAVGAGSLTSVPASSEKPLTVLRYE